ncbi:MAG TPA: hypothetical protein VL172_23025, partial [Kofleriaceae bacterium]|nr:hypothetical protein [Kofleriaceae bacterium]
PASGEVALVVPPGGMVTVAWPHSFLETVTGIDEGIDRIDFRQTMAPDLDDPDIIGLNLPAGPEGTADYWVTTSCGPVHHVDPADAADLISVVVDGCADQVDVAVAALDASGRAIAVAGVADVARRSGIATVDAWAPPATVDVSLARPALAFDTIDLSLHQQVTAGGFAFPEDALPSPMPAALTQRLRYVGGLGQGGSVVLGTWRTDELATERRELTVGFDGSPTALAADGAPLLPEMAVAGDSNGGVDWAADIDADYIQIGLVYATTVDATRGEWYVWAPPAAGHVALPSLPADVAGRGPAGNTVDVDSFLAVEADYLDGYAGVPAAGDPPANRVVSSYLRRSQ